MLFSEYTKKETHCKRTIFPRKELCKVNKLLFLDILKQSELRIKNCSYARSVYLTVIFFEYTKMRHTPKNDYLFSTKKTT